MGHLQSMDPCHTPKDLMYRELAEGSRPVGHPRLHYKIICKRDMKLSDIDVHKWENYARDSAKWRSTVREGVMRVEERRRAEHVDKRRRRKQWGTLSLLPTNHYCSG